MARFAKVPRKQSPCLRKTLISEGKMDLGLRAIDLGEFVLLPITDETMNEDADRLGFEIALQPKDKKLVYRNPIAEVKGRLRLSPDFERLLPRKWELIGDVLVLRMPNELERELDEIAATYADVLGAKTVCQEIGPIEGIHRMPRMKVLYGSNTETVHKENGVLYKLDVAKVMFSSGNKAEKLRMSKLDCRGETVVDMFAGIGYFTLPIAKHAKPEKVIACEINPVAFHYLKENTALNHLENVEPRLGDNRSLPGEKFADRALMGYVGITSAFLPKAFSLVREGGIIHYHDVCPVERFPERLMKNIEMSADGRSVEVLRMAEVKSYAPLVSHFVIDIRVI